MSLISIAGQCGVPSDTLKKLIAGKVSPSVAMRLGVPSASLQTFVDGGKSVGLAGVMGTTSLSLQELRNLIGREGAIGLLIGLMAGMPSD